MKKSHNIVNNKKILFIPSWIDVEFKTPAQSTFTDFPRVINEVDGLTAGMIYAEMHIQQFRRRYIEVEGLPYPYLGMRAWTPPKRGRLWNIWVKKYMELYGKYVEKYWKPDLLHAHGILGGVTALEISRQYKIPYIHTEHLGGESIKSLPRSYHSKYREIAKTASIITTVSRANTEFLQKKFAMDVKHIPNFINTDFFLPKQKTVEKPIFISIGEPAYTKGLDRLLKSFIEVKKELPDALLILVDKIRDKERLIDPVIKKNKLWESIIFTGIVDRQEIRKLIQSAAVLISSSRFETFGMTMAEALSCGTPVVATQTDGSSDIIQKDVGRSVEQGDIDALTQAILEVYTQRKKYAPQKLHEYIEEKFSERHIVPQWKNIYLDV